MIFLNKSGEFIQNIVVVHDDIKWQLPTCMESTDDVNRYVPTRMKLMIEQIYMCEFIENNCDLATCLVNMNWQNSYKQVLTKWLN